MLGNVDPRAKTPMVKYTKALNLENTRKLSQSPMAKKFDCRKGFLARDLVKKCTARVKILQEERMFAQISDNKIANAVKSKRELDKESFK